VTTNAGCALFLAAGLVLGSNAGWAAPRAGAVTPPPIDGELLPVAKAPAPSDPTEQSESCSSSAQPAKPEAALVRNGLDLRSLWQLSRGAGQTVAVIDTGVARHRLLPHLAPGGDYVSTGDGTQDCDGHGTIVAGIIGAAPIDREDGTFGGVAPDASVLSIRQSSNKFRRSADSAGGGVGDVETMAMAVRTAADLGATVINISSVACVPADQDIGDGALGAALAYAVDVKNVVVVAAAGNLGGAGHCDQQNPPSDPARPGTPNWDGVKFVVSPSWYDDYVLTVGSVGPDGSPSQFSLAGPWVDVATPGEMVVALDPAGEGLIDSVPGSTDAKPISGTSYAAPVVAGIAALIRSRSPQLSARQVMKRIEDTAHEPGAGWDPRVGEGVVDPLAAVSADDTGGASRPRATASPLVPASAVGTDVDGRSRTFAFGGAAICVGMAAAAMTISTGRLRRRRDGVTDD
jgi:membrane-anchored mycosin MYCP